MKRFNPSPLNLNRISTDLEQSGLEQGRVNLPSHVDTELDENQTNLIIKFKDKHNTLLEELLDYIGKIKEIASKFLARRLDLVFDNLINKYRTEVKTQRAREKNKLLSLANSKYAELRSLDFFQQKHKISRPATYPTSNIFHYSIIITIILLESMANSYLFGKGSDLGLLGGFLRACLVSLANVGSALIVGVYIIPFVNHIQITKKVFSILGQSIYWAISIMFNITAAHYRDLLAKDLNPVFSSIESLLNNPFDFSLDGFVLLIVGIGAAILAAIKGYTSDDPYPGYGPVDRKFHSATENLGNFKTKEINEIQDLSNGISNEFNKQLKDLKKESILLANFKDKGNEALVTYSKNVDMINSEFISRLKKYREANLAVRTDPHPQYFNDYTNIITNSNEPERSWEENFLTAENDFNKDLEILENRESKFHDKVLEILDQTIREIEDSNEQIIQQVENQALNRIAQ